MSSRTTVDAAVAAVLAEAAPVRLADLPEEQADYLRRLGATRGLATDAEVDAALSESPAEDAADLDAIASRARR